MKSKVAIDPNPREQENSSGRLYFLDNLKTFIILFVVFFLPGKIGEACYNLSYFFFCITAVFLLFALFQKHIGFTSRLLGSLSANSYAIYFIHYFVILWIILALRELQWNAFVKWLLVGILSILVSYFVARYALAKTPMFSAKVRPVQGSR